MFLPLLNILCLYELPSGMEVLLCYTAACDMDIRVYIFQTIVVVFSYRKRRLRTSQANLSQKERFISLTTA